MSGAHNKLFDIRLDDHNFVARNPEVEHERRIAIYDLLEDNSFEILGSDRGPYSLLLKRREARLIFGVSGDDGRRSLHDEGAEMLREKLSRKVKVDDSTARRLFTLICVLHVRG